MGRFGKNIGVGFAVLFAAGLTQAAQAQDCPPLTKFTSVKLETLSNSRRVLVPVTINNVPKKFLLDTAGMAAYITRESADELKLERMAGQKTHVRKFQTFGLGGRTYEIPNTTANDSTLISAEYPVSSDKDGDIDGTLTNGFLFARGELDIDFPGGTLSIFSPDHCPGKVNYWGAPDIGSLPLSYDVIDPSARFGSIFGENVRFKRTMQIDLGHLTVPVTLDGQSFNAWIDTSAEKSSISLEVAERIFKIPREKLGPLSEVKVTPEAALGFYNPYIRGANNWAPTPKPVVARAEVYRHKFSQLTLGHIDVKNLELLVMPDRWGRNNDVARQFYYMPEYQYFTEWAADIAGQGANRGRYSAFSNERRDVPDMVLGMDVLRHLHVYFALKEKRMYFSTGTAAPAPAAQ